MQFINIDLNLNATYTSRASKDFTLSFYNVVKSSMFTYKI